MPILRIRRRPLNVEQYDAAVAAIDLEHHHPLGLIMHGAAAVDGRMQVAQVWESEEYARRYDEEELEPALRALGVPLELETDVAIFELHHLVTP